MAAVADRMDFLRILALSKLIDPQRLEALQSEPDFPNDHGEIAEKLIKSGDLTRFQAKSLLAGRHRGFRLGRHRVLDQIGKGGMGTVFLTEDAQTREKYAVKVLAKELDEDAAAIERFQREARAAAALNHSNVVRVYELGEAEGSRYLVMEYVNGATLEQIIDRKGPFTVVQAVRLALQAAAGLHHAHLKGFVHRDIKPENLMLSRDGTLKILDMGLTKSFRKGEDNLTARRNSQHILGTIDYLSPEQAINGPLDQRSDIYSLGATLFTIITGHSPYEGVPPRQKLIQHQSGAVPNLMEFHSDVPKPLAMAVMKMMAKKPADRFTTMAEVDAALRPWAELSPSTSTAVHLPSGVTAASAMNRSMTPTLRDAASNTARHSRVGSFAIMAPPLPIAEAAPGSRRAVPYALAAALAIAAAAVIGAVVLLR